LQPLHQQHPALFQLRIRKVRIPHFDETVPDPVIKENYFYLAVGLVRFLDLPEDLLAAEQLRRQERLGLLHPIVCFHGLIEKLPQRRELLGGLLFRHARVVVFRAPVRIRPVRAVVAPAGRAKVLAQELLFLHTHEGIHVLLVHEIPFTGAADARALANLDVHETSCLTAAAVYSLWRARHSAPNLKQI
jgi:hypothetical protein